MSDEKPRPPWVMPSVWDGGSTLKVLKDLDAFTAVASSSILSNYAAFPKFDAVTVLGSSGLFKNSATVALTESLGKTGFVSAFEAIGRTGILSAYGGGRLPVAAGIGAVTKLGTFDAATVFGNMDMSLALGSVNASKLFAGFDPARMFADLDLSLQEEALEAATAFAGEDTQTLAEALEELDLEAVETESIDFVSLDLDDSNVRRVIGIGVAFYLGLVSLAWQMNNPELVALFDQLDRSVLFGLAIYAVVVGRQKD